MEKTNLENLNRLAKLFGTDRLISPEDIQEIRSILIGVLANNKKEVESLTEETKQAINSVLEKVLNEHDTYLEKTKQIAQEAKSETTEAITQAKKDFEEVKALCKEVMECKPENGEDADEEYVIGEVLNRIKLPEYKEIVLDDGGAIVDKINSLPVNEENQIDAKHIKNLPEVKGGKVISGGVTRKIVEQMIAASGAAGVDLEVEGIPNVDQGKLNLLGGTNMTITDNGDGSVTFDATGGGASPLTTKGDLYTYSTVDARLGVGTNGQVLTADSAETTGLKWTTVSGTGDVVGPASSTDNAIVRFDGTTGKLVQNSAATIADTSGNITAGTYNGNTIGAGSTSGTNTGDQTTISGNAGTATALQTARTIGTITGDATSAGSSFDGSANNTNALTLATVNSNVGTFGSATQASQVTVNAKGLVTAISAQTVTPAVGSITGLGTGVGTALAVNVGSAGAFVTFNGALGTPSSGTVTNLTGTASININGTVGATTPTTGAFTTASTSSTLTASTTIELGHATDTTLSRVSAGVMAVEGVTVATSSNTLTLTNKRPQPRTASSTTASTLTPDLSSANVYYRTTQTATLTIEAPTGTPVIGETIAIYVDSAGAQTLTMDSTYKVFGAAFPATTTAGKTLMITAQYNGTDWKTLWANAV